MKAKTKRRLKTLENAVVALIEELREERNKRRREVGRLESIVLKINEEACAEYNLLPF